MTPHSITDDGHSVYIGSYNTLDASAHENWVWRSDDDGQTWQVVMDTTTHRHIHFVQADPTTHWVYVGFGDAGRAEIDVTRDQGATWSPLCTGDQCLAVDMAFDPSGFALFGQDIPYGTSNIQRVDLATGAVSTIMRLPGISYSTLRLPGGVWLIGTTHGPGTAYVPGDLDVHLFASIDGGKTFSDVYDTPYAAASNSFALKVQFAYPNGDFPIQATGGGTVVAHIDDPSPPTTTSATTTTTATTHDDHGHHDDDHGDHDDDHGHHDNRRHHDDHDAGDNHGHHDDTTATSTTPAASPPSQPGSSAGAAASGGGGGGGSAPPDLRVTATADAKTIAPGQNVTFSIDVSLVTAGSATGIILDVHLPDNVSLAQHVREPRRGVSPGRRLEPPLRPRLAVAAPCRRRGDRRPGRWPGPRHADRHRRRKPDRRRPKQQLDQPDPRCARDFDSPAASSVGATRHAAGRPPDLRPPDRRRHRPDLPLADLLEVEVPRRPGGPGPVAASAPEVEGAASPRDRPAQRGRSHATRSRAKRPRSPERRGVGASERRRLSGSSRRIVA